MYAAWYLACAYIYRAYINVHIINFIHSLLCDLYTVIKFQADPSIIIIYINLSISRLVHFGKNTIFLTQRTGCIREKYTAGEIFACKIGLTAARLACICLLYESFCQYGDLYFLE